MAAPQPFGLADRMYRCAGGRRGWHDGGHRRGRISPATLRFYDVSEPNATLRGTVDGWTQEMSNLIDLAITADGSMVVSAFGF